MKDTHDEKFEHVDKIMPCLFFQKRLKNGQLQKIQQHHAKRFEKTLSLIFLDF